MPCSVVCCRSEKNSLHSFPKDLHVRREWTLFCGRSSDWIPGPAAKICSIHFSSTDLTRGRRVKLSAVPKLQGPKDILKRSGSEIWKFRKRLCEVGNEYFSVSDPDPDPDPH
jgi:hypothetical protein